MRQIGPGVPGLWSNKQTNRQTVIITLFIYIIQILTSHFLLKKNYTKHNVSRLFWRSSLVTILWTTQSIYKFGLSGCLFVSKKRQNGWTDRAQIFCGTSRDLRDHREGKFQIFVSIKIRSPLNFLNFENPRNFLWKSANYFCFVLRSTQREHVHN